MGGRAFSLLRETTLNIAFVGHGAMGHRILRSLLLRGAPVVSVACHRDDPYEQPFIPSVADLADDAGIEYIFQGPPGELPPLEIGRDDLLISAGYRTIIPEARLPSRAFNFHASLLPRYRGRCPLNWALIHGEKQTGVTLHDMHGGVDTGGIAGQAVIPIGPDTTIQTLSLLAEDAAADLLECEYGYLLFGDLDDLTPQSDEFASRFPGRRPEDGRFQWSWPAERIHNLVRALTRPWPGAYVDEPKCRRYVWKTRIDSLGNLQVLDDEVYS